MLSRKWQQVDLCIPVPPKRLLVNSVYLQNGNKLTFLYLKVDLFIPKVVKGRHVYLVPQVYMFQGGNNFISGSVSFLFKIM